MTTCAPPARKNWKKRRKRPTECKPMERPPRIAYSAMIRDTPATERPREKLKNFGPDHLSNAELIAILLRTGVKGEGVIIMAQRLLQHFGGLAGLARANFVELCAEHGISEAKASQLLAAMALGRRLSNLKTTERYAVNSPRDVASLLFGEMSFLDKEHLKTVLLNTKNEIMGVREIYVGNVNSSMARPSEIFRPAIRENCPSIIVVHNHPSGDPTPSADDIVVTRRLVEAGKILEIEMMDHIVIGSDERYVSLKEKGLGF